MKLIEALEILAVPRTSAAPFEVFLACGFEPLHLRTHLAAELQVRCPDRRVVVETGLYGELLANLDRAAPRGVPVAVALEWPDLDPRLGLRLISGWRPRDADDVRRTAAERSERIESALRAIVRRAPVVLSLPTLPLPPIDHVPGVRAGDLELGLRARVASLADRLAADTEIRIASPRRLDRESPPDRRLDVRSELQHGFPYTRSHAASLAAALAALVRPPTPRKGLITDLDDVVWRGILGEVGVEGVTWDIADHAQAHALYQQQLLSLSEAGVLLAAVTKNDPVLVEEAFRRKGLILPRERLFPIDAGWHPKSESVARILDAWNVAADGVVFVDDTALELAEVAAAHPGVECVRFPHDDDGVYRLLERLRDLFGKERILPEDALRSASVRGSTAIRAAAGHGSAPDSFLEAIEAEIAVSFDGGAADRRALELVNKTNQFNLNGRRHDETSWCDHLARAGAFLMRASYRDKFGPLGTIAVLSGVRNEGLATLETWVMSCRAFSRRIEHRCLEVLFEELGVEEVELDFAPTPRNGAIREFLAELLGKPPVPAVRLSKAAFRRNRPALHHRVIRSCDGVRSS